MDNKEYYQLKYIINKFHNFYAFLFTDEEYKILVDKILEAIKTTHKNSKDIYFDKIKNN